MSNSAEARILGVTIVRMEQDMTTASRHVPEPTSGSTVGSPSTASARAGAGRWTGEPISGPERAH